MFAGLGADELSRRELGRPAEHRAIESNDSALHAIHSPQMKAQYKELIEAFDVVGFTHEQRNDLLR